MYPWWCWLCDGGGAFADICGPDKHQYAVICPFQSCPDSVRTRVTNTEFSRGFLRSVPVLQWARHATREQYERLSRYYGSYGWGGVQNDSEFLLLLLSCADFQVNLNSAFGLSGSAGRKKLVLRCNYSPSWSQTGVNRTWSSYNYSFGLATARAGEAGRRCAFIFFSI